MPAFIYLSKFMHKMRISNHTFTQSHKSFRGSQVLKAAIYDGKTGMKKEEIFPFSLFEY